MRKAVLLRQADIQRIEYIKGQISYRDLKKFHRLCVGKYESVSKNLEKLWNILNETEPSPLWSLRLKAFEALSRKLVDLVAQDLGQSSETTH